MENEQNFICVREERRLSFKRAAIVSFFANKSLSFVHLLLLNFKTLIGIYFKP